MEDGADGRLVQVLLDRIAVLPDEPLYLPMPANKKLTKDEQKEVLQYSRSLAK